MNTTDTLTPSQTEKNKENPQTQTSGDLAHDHESTTEAIQKGELATRLVFALTLATMVLEIAAGYLTGSMALLADGWHMATHAGAMLVTLITYRLVRNWTTARRKVGLALGGYTNAVFLAVVALWMGVECIVRLLNPVAIQFTEAIMVATIGLVVNIVSAFLLHPSRCAPKELQGTGAFHDHNLHGAFLHVLADTLTSVFALIALFAAKLANLYWVDALIGLIGMGVILRWSYRLGTGSVKQIVSQQS